MDIQRVPTNVYGIHLVLQILLATQVAGHSCKHFEESVTAMPVERAHDDEVLDETPLTWIALTWQGGLTQVCQSLGTKNPQVIHQCNGRDCPSGTCC
jgi:hypothetical protein